MTLTVKGAIDQAQKAYVNAVQMRHREDLIEEVQRLSKAGVTHDTIAALMGLNPRQIVRICNGQVSDVKAPQRSTFAVDDIDRQHRLEQTADAALQLAVMQRDEDPQLVWDALDKLDRHALQELTAVCLAGIPVDQPKSAIFGWVAEMAS